MTLSSLDAVKFGLTALYAEDMFIQGQRLPAPEPRIDALGWKVVAYLVARDAVLPPRSGLRSQERKMLRFGETVFYGYLAQSKTDADSYVAAIRGTESFAEWVIDAEFLAIKYAKKDGATVEEGFWGVYDSMQLVELDGVTAIGKAAEGIAQKINPTGRVTVTGHSLGSALATYLSLETAQIVGERASACMFASPHPGNHVFAAYYDAMLGNRYGLYNYVLDLVPYVPFSLPLQNIDYAPLPKATVINPLTSQADVRVDIGCNHHILSYCAELDYDYTKATPKTPGDQQLFKCVLGPREVSANEALADVLALAFKALLTNGAMLRQAATKMGWHPI